MHKDKLKVGCIVANYNTGKYFPDCVTGLLSQTRKPDVVIVVDDGSTDDSWQLIMNTLGGRLAMELGEEDYKKSQHSFKIEGVHFNILQLDKNYGPSFARNVALQYLLPRVDVICVADADDIYYPTKIEKSIAVMLKYPEVALVYSDYDTEDIRTGEIKREYKEIFSFKRLFEECIVSNNSVFASKIIGLTGGYDDTIRGGEDYDLWLRMSEYASIYHIPEALYRYRLTGQNSTLTIPKDTFAQYVGKVHAKAMERRNRKIRS